WDPRFVSDLGRPPGRTLSGHARPSLSENIIMDLSTRVFQRQLESDDAMLGMDLAKRRGDVDQAHALLVESVRSPVSKLLHVGFPREKDLGDVDVRTPPTEQRDFQAVGPLIHLAVPDVRSARPNGLEPLETTSLHTHILSSRDRCKPAVLIVET